LDELVWTNVGSCSWHEFLISFFALALFLQEWIGIVFIGWIGLFDGWETGVLYFSIEDSLGL